MCKIISELVNDKYCEKKSWKICPSPRYVFLFCSSVSMYKPKLMLPDNMIGNQVSIYKETVWETEVFILKPLKQAACLQLWSKHSTASWGAFTLGCQLCEYRDRTGWWHNEGLSTTQKGVRLRFLGQLIQLWELEFHIIVLFILP